MAHAVDVHVGKRLKQVRNQRRMSQTDVAKRLKLSFQQIQKYEIGSNRIAASRLFELSHILDVPTSYFFEGLSDTTPTERRLNGLDIVNALAAIEDENIKSRIMTFIEDVSGLTVARQAS
ncbi:helix-turn-helix domain-containing protein [Tateyamaria sp.]|jgi:transcriptional regulator with XRE-family HTH domain|nr:helix-turn-helix domain-containing protein [Tateyamaria sp.]